MSWTTLPPDLRTVAEHELTRKQLDVFKLWVGGASYRRIATMLQIATPTARGHLESVHHRLERHGWRRSDADPRTYHRQEAA